MTGSYTCIGLVRLAWEVLLTRLGQPGARLIRRPFYVRGKRNISFGHGITIGRSARIEAFGQTGEINIRFGEGVQINDYVHIGSVRSVTIGDRALIAGRVFISDHNHGIYNDKSVKVFSKTHGETSRRGMSQPSEPPADRALSVASVVIGDDVWLGEGVCVLPGVTIGEGSVVGANAVVTRDIPPGCIAVGNPAKVVRRYDPAHGWKSVGARESKLRRSLTVVRNG